MTGSEPHVRYEQRALFTSVRVPNTVPGQALIFVIYSSQMLGDGKHALRASVTTTTILPNVLSKQLRPTKKCRGEISVNLKLFFL